MSFTSLLNHSCYKGTSASSQNSLGEWTYTWTYSTDEISCRGLPITYAERVQAPTAYRNVSYKIYLSSGNGLTLDNRLSYGGEYYRIVDIHPDSSYHHYTALVSRISV